MKARVFGLFFGILLAFSTVANVYAAGYVCDSIKYTSCGAGYYMTLSGSYNGSPQSGNACSTCPSAAEYCPGGTYAPAYKVTLNANGGTGGTTAIYRVQNVGWFSSLKKSTTPATSLSGIGDPFSTLPSKPTRTGYTFNGFYDATSGGTQTITSAGVVSASNAYGTATWYAQWTATRYKITLNGNGAAAAPITGCTIDGNVSKAYYVYDTTKFVCETGNSTTLTSLPVPSRTGYKFKGYYSAASGGKQITNASGELIDKNFTTSAMTIYAQWTAISKTCSAGQYFNLTECADCTSGYYCPNGSKEYTYDGNIQGRYTCPTNSSTNGKTGQASCTCNTGYNYNDGTTATTNACVANTYTIKYDSAGGSSVSSTSCTYGSACTVTTTVPTKKGYTFTGWKNGSTSYTSGQSVQNLTSTNGATVTLTAQWTANTFTLKHVSDGTVVREKTCTYDSACTVTTTVPTKTGYTFGGWSYNGKIYTSGQDVKNLVNTNGATVTFAAQWTVNEYPCAAGKYLDGTTCKTCESGYYCPGDTYTYNAGIQGRSTCPTIYTKSDTGASSNKQCYIITEAGKMILYPSSGTESLCSANYYCSGGVKIYYGEYGGSTACPANSSTNGATGQTKCTCNTGYNYNDGTTTASDACVANTYTINYDSVGGSAIPDTLCIYGQNCTVSSTKPTKTGYTFTGWLYNNITYQADDTVPSLTSINGDTVTFTAQWQPNTFTIIYVSNDGSGNMENTTCTYDTDCYITKNTYTRTGYTFKNWANSDKSLHFEDGANLRNASSSQGAGLFLYAQWEPITYTITYDKNGGSGSMANTKCTYGTLCVLDKNTFYKAGYEFDGWLFNNKKYTDGQSVSDLTVVNTDNLVFVAQWKPAVISCPAGQYLDGLNCNNCEDEYYCEGGEWLYDGGIHGRKDCPVTTETYGAAENLGFLDVLATAPHTSIEECRATFAYVPEWSKTQDPSIEFDTGYNPQANNRGLYFVSCDYNPTTQQYDSNCTGFPLSCDAGYVSSTNVDLATDFEDLSQNLYYATSPQDAIEKTCVPVGYNHWTPSMQECSNLSDDEVMYCVYGKSIEKNICPDGGITLTDTSGAITDCLKNDVECSTELGAGIKTCYYDETTGGYNNCGECSVDSCKSGYYMNNGICTTCPAGSACTDNVITTCGANTWTTTNSAQCNACPANSSTNGQTGQTQCICNTGYNYNNGTTVTVNDCVPNTFTVKYDAGLGDGNMADTVCDYDGNCVAADNAFVNIGHNFVGWLCSGGSCNGNIIQAGASLINATVENNAVITLTAQWSTSAISCPAGEYLDGADCKSCPDDSYCVGGSWEYNGQIQGLEKCPTITEKYGAASAELLDALEHAPHSAANQCRAVFEYAERWYLDFVNNTNVDAGYDEKVNERGLFFVSCDYNPVTRLYDKNCTGVALMCGAGYWSPHNADITDVNELINNVYVATGPQDAIENTCAKVGDGYWSPSAEGQLDNNAGDILQQLSLQYVGRNQCKDALRTIGYGKGADESTDCGRILHIGENKLYLRSVKRTTPSLHVRVDGVVYYGDMSKTETKMNTESNRALRIVDKGIPYWVHDDSVL